MMVSFYFVKNLDGSYLRKVLREIVVALVMYSIPSSELLHGDLITGPKTRDADLK